MINKTSPVTIYYQLKEKLKKQIGTGVFGLGGFIPPENNLQKNTKLAE